MSMYGRDPWGGPLEIAADSATDDDRSRNLQDYDRAALSSSRQLDETQQSWLLGPAEQKKKKKYVDLGCIIVSRKIFVWTVGSILAVGLLVGFIALIVKLAPRRHHSRPPPDNYTQALNKALMFFNAQKSGRLPKHNNVSWRGNSCLNDGKAETGTFYKDLVGGFYDAGDAIKFNFPGSFAMTMLSWSVIEYSAKYEAAGELNHVKEIIKWGADYFLKTFNSSADTIDALVAQVGSGDTSGGSTTPNDHYCWTRPEDIDYKRPVTTCSSCSDLGAEMAAALASASIVFKDNKAYSQKLVHGAKTLYKFARMQRGRYSEGNEAATFYNSTMYWDEFVWGGAWLYYATGNNSYLYIATHPKMAKHAGAFWGGPDYGVLSWDNKLTGAQVLLSRLRLFLSPGYPYEEILSAFHNQTGIIMCSYLPYFNSHIKKHSSLLYLISTFPFFSIPLLFSLLTHLPSIFHQTSSKGTKNQEDSLDLTTFIMASLTTPISIGAPQPWPSSSSPPPSSSKAYNYNYDCSLSLCSVNCPQFCGIVIPPPPPLFLNPNDGSNDDSSSSSHISPLMAALIAVLAAAFLLLLYFTVISKLCRRRRNQTRFLDPDNADRIDSLIYDSTRPTTNNESGLDDSFIRQITVFKFRREDKLVEGTECAVCLTEFNENESLRLMPNCEHAFHLPCIDTWLKTHSNCPLCRSTMNPVPVPVPVPNPNPTARSSVGSMGPVSNNNAATASVAALRVQHSNDAVLVIRELESRVQVVETTADDEVGSRGGGGGGGECRNYIIEDNNINNNNNNNKDTKLEINK